MQQVSRAFIGVFLFIQGMTATVDPFVCPSEDGFYAVNPDICSADYYACVNGSPYVLTCPAGSVFDPIRQTCVNEELASCKAHMDLVQSVGAASRLAKFVCPGSGQFEYEKCSDLYYVCSGGNYVIARCPPGQIFDPETSFCQDPSQVQGCSF